MKYRNHKLDSSDRMHQSTDTSYLYTARQPDINEWIFNLDLKGEVTICTWLPNNSWWVGESVTTVWDFYILTSVIRAAIDEIQIDQSQ